MTLLAEGPRLRIEGSGLPYTFVMDDEKHEASWFIPKKNDC